MISRYLDKIKDNELKENITAGLAAGLVTGIAFGLAIGLAAGLAAGLAVGLAFGLVAGLAVGLVTGLVSGLVSGLVFGLTHFSQLSISFWIFAIIVIILMEFIFLFNRKGYKKGSKFLFTVKRKVEALIESLLIVVNVLNVRYLIKNYTIPYSTILKWVGYIGAGIIALAFVAGGILYVWIKMNETRIKR